MMRTISANHAIHQVLQHHDNVIFANGGDRIKSFVPEYEKYKNDERVKFVFNVGGERQRAVVGYLIMEESKDTTQVGIL